LIGTLNHSKILEEFLEDVFLGVGMESLLGEAKVQSHQTKITAQKGSNFLSDRWIVHKFLQ
jgi:hypothetical protein